jgi:hypothetical protein
MIIRISFLLSLCLLFCQFQFKSDPKPILRGNLLIHLPTDATQKSYPVLIAFGGSMWATPQFLWKNTPNSYFEKAILVYSPCYTKGGGNLRKVESETRHFLKDKGIQSGQFSVCGFSSGGPDVMIAETPYRYRAIGLIDCSPVANGKVQYSANMIFSFRRNNWVNSDYYGKVVNFKPFNDLMEQIRRVGGCVEESDVSHEGYFRYFLEKFERELIGE